MACSRRFTDLIGRDDFEAADTVAGELKATIDQEQQTHRVRRAAGVAAIQADRPIRVETYLASELGPARRREAEAGVEGFAQMVDQSLSNVLRTVIRPVRRGEPDRSKYADGTIYMRTTADSGVIVHELGHAIEDQMPELLQASLQFVHRRAAGRSAVRQGGWSNLVGVARPDA